MDAVSQTVQADNGKSRLDLDRIGVRKQLGKSCLEHRRVKGFVFLPEIRDPWVRRKVESARIVTLKDDLELKPRSFKLTRRSIVLDELSKTSMISEEENRIGISNVGEILKTRANLIVEKGIDPG